MERKYSRRVGRQVLPPLDKTMIGRPTNFAHVGSMSNYERFADDDVSAPSGSNPSDGPDQTKEEERDLRENEEEEEERTGRVGGRGGGGGSEEEEEGEDVPPLPPLSPNASRRNSRRISKDMISFPTNFRHVLHIDPTSADSNDLLMMMKSGGGSEHELEEEEEEENEPVLRCKDPPEDTQEASRDPSDPPRVPKTAKPSFRVRKSMISFPTNFQHVNHISAGERLNAPESPPPQVPPEPHPVEEREPQGREHTQEPLRKPSRSSCAPSFPVTHNPTAATIYDTPSPIGFSSSASSNPSSSYVTNIPVAYPSPSPLPRPPLPPVGVPSGDVSYSSASSSASRLEEKRERSEAHTKSFASQETAETDFDLNIVQFRIPPPPPLHQNGDDTPRSSSCIPEFWKREESAKEKPLKEDYKWGGREREKERRREGGKERRTPSLPPPFPHRSPSQEHPPPLPPLGKLRKASIGPPTNFQHVTHIGFGRLESDND